MSCPRAQWPMSFVVACAGLPCVAFMDVQLTFEDKPLDLKTGLRPFGPHRVDLRGGGTALLLYARGSLVARPCAPLQA